MNLPFKLTVNSVLMIIIGLGLIVFGGWFSTYVGFRLFGAGFFFTGIGNVLFGMTNGFTDMTSPGRLLYRLALVAYLAGVPIIGYYLLTELF